MYIDPTGYSSFWQGLWDGFSGTFVDLYNAIIHFDQTLAAIVNDPLGAVGGVLTSLWNFIPPVMFYHMATADSWYEAGRVLGGYYGEGALIVASYGAGKTISTIRQLKIPTKIKGFTAHGNVSAMTHHKRGVSTKAMFDAVKSPTTKVAYDAMRKTYKFVGKDAVVILNKKGMVVTTWPTNPAGWRFLDGTF